MPSSATAFCALSAVALFAFLHPSLVEASAKAASPFNRLCQGRKITSESQWRTCALRTVQEWNDGTIKVMSSNLTTMRDYYVGLIDSNITVRVEPLGTFSGLEMVVEYETIFASPTGPVQVIKPLSYKIRRFTALRPLAVATIDCLFMNVFTGTTANLTIEQWFRFNDFNRVAAADFNLARYVEFMPALNLDAVLASNPNISASLVSGVCQAAAAFCTAPSLAQYADVPSCLGFLSSIPFINPLRTQSNSVLCRFLHASLVAYEPNIHCAHIGPSGGGVCIDEPYAAYYTGSPFAPGTFSVASP